MTNKTCSKCKIEKETKEFSKYSKTKDGLGSYCKSCAIIYNKNRTEKGITKEYNKRNSRNKSLNNICASCKFTRLNTNRFCLSCWISNSILHAYKIPLEEKKILTLLLKEKLERNEYSCFYSNVKITPGLTASLDHRMPKSKGGKDVISNLEWCHIGVNKIKGNLSEKEFINRYSHVLVELNSLGAI